MMCVCVCVCERKRERKMSCHCAGYSVIFNTVLFYLFLLMM